MRLLADISSNALDISVSKTWFNLDLRRMIFGRRLLFLLSFLRCYFGVGGKGEFLSIKVISRLPFFVIFACFFWILLVLSY